MKCRDDVEASAMVDFRVLCGGLGEILDDMEASDVVVFEGAAARWRGKRLAFFEKGPPMPPFGQVDRRCGVCMPILSSANFWVPFSGGVLL